MTDDLISRQAAIDELKTRRDAAKKWYDEVSVTDDILTARADSAMASFIEAILIIKKLPSAQPEKRTEERTETHECDCINRQAALSLAKDIVVPTKEGYTYRHTCIDPCDIMELPSAHPEPSEVARDIATILENEQDMRVMLKPERKTGRLTDEDIQTIRIHMNAYKERLCNQRRWKEAEEYQHIVDKLDELMEVEHG